MKTIFQFRDGCHLHGDAQAVGERLESIKAKRELTPEQVLKDARNIRSPLHTFFEWDDSKAAERYRLDQAGHLIRSVTVIFEATPQQQQRQITLDAVPAPPLGIPKPVRAFVAIKSDDTGERSYVSTADAMNDPALRRQVLERAHSEMVSVGQKYRALQELGDVFTALDRVDALLHRGEGQTA